MSALQTKVPGNQQSCHAQDLRKPGSTFGVLFGSFRGKERVGDKDQADTVMMSELLENDLSTIPHVRNGDNLNFLFYLMALDE